MAGYSRALLGTFAAVIGAFGLFTAPAALAADEIQNANTTESAPVPVSLRPISQAQLDAAANDSASWLQSNGSYSETRYAPAAQINRSNVAKLKPAFIFQTAVM